MWHFAVFVAVGDGLWRAQPSPGAGIGWIDAHLLTAALLSNVGLWTVDRALGRASGRLGLAAGS